MSYQLINVSYSYGKLEVLKNISLNFDQGSIHAIVGQNGAGKTTLMRILGNYLVPDKGEIKCSHESIAMVHQHFMLVDEFTVEENLLLAQLDNSYHENDPCETVKKAEKILEELGWQLPFQRKVRELSIGDHQRLEILKAVLQNTPYIILDEPTAVLSELEVESLFKNLRYLAEQGKGIILIAHKPSEVIQIADRISVLREGNLVWTKENKNISCDELALAIVGKEFQKELTEKKIISNSQILLEIKNCNTFSNHHEIALKDICLTLATGKIIGIGGIEGNGQREIAELILNFRKLKQGERIEKKNMIFAYLPQNPLKEALAPQMSLIDNLLIDCHRLSFLRKGLLWNKGLRNWAIGRMAKFEVKYENLDQKVSSLSGGNQQKLILSRLESLNADIWVAMNPTRGLDVSATYFIHQKIKEYAQNGSCIVLISSDLEELNSLSNEILFMHKGRLQKEFLAS